MHKQNLPPSPTPQRHTHTELLWEIVRDGPLCDSMAMLQASVLVLCPSLLLLSDCPDLHLFSRKTSPNMTKMVQIVLAHVHSPPLAVPGGGGPCKQVHSPVCAHFGAAYHHAGTLETIPNQVDKLPHNISKHDATPHNAYTSTSALHTTLCPLSSLQASLFPLHSFGML
jgi:hypothetical protein